MSTYCCGVALTVAVHVTVSVSSSVFCVAATVTLHVPTPASSVTAPVVTDRARREPA
jgi:hypothetical protein